MRLFVGKRPVQLPTRPCDAQDVQREVTRINPPFVVSPPEGKPFAIKRRVFLEAAGVRVECEDDSELRMACKLSAEDHNQWQISDEAAAVTQDTEHLEKEIANRIPEEDDWDDGVPHEEEDISLEEWAQLGYKWFKKDEMVYI